MLWPPAWYSTDDTHPRSESGADTAREDAETTPMDARFRTRNERADEASFEQVSPLTGYVSPPVLGQSIMGSVPYRKSERRMDLQLKRLNVTSGTSIASRTLYCRI